MTNRLLIVFVVSLLVIVGGCLGPEYSSSPEVSFSADSRSSFQEQAPVEGGISGLQDRKIISTATLTIEVKDVQEAFNEITAIMQDAGGFISSSSIYEGSGSYNGEVTIRVPQKNFIMVIEQVENVGQVKFRKITGEDVTEEFIDLNARLGNLKKQEIRLQDILEMATTVKEVLEVEHELERVRGEIERLTGRLNYLNQSVDMSTIQVILREPALITGEGPGITDALKQAVKGFLDSVKGLIIFTGYSLPILMFIAFVILIALGIKRRILPKLKG